MNREHVDPKAIRWFEQKTGREKRWALIVMAIGVAGALALNFLGNIDSFASSFAGNALTFLWGLTVPLALEDAHVVGLFMLLSTAYASYRMLFQRKLYGLWACPKDNHLFENIEPTSDYELICPSCGTDLVPVQDVRVIRPSAGATPKISAAGTEPNATSPVIPATAAPVPSTGGKRELTTTQNLSIRLAQGCEWLPLNRMDNHWHWCQVTPEGFGVLKLPVSGSKEFGIHVGTDSKTARACVETARWARGSAMANVPQSTALIATATTVFDSTDGTPTIASGFNYINEMQQADDQESYVGRFVTTIEDREDHNAPLLVDGAELFLTFFNPKDARLGSNWDVVILRISANSK
jgi:hypothetical protein